MEPREQIRVTGFALKNWAVAQEVPMWVSMVAPVILGFAIPFWDSFSLHRCWQ
jgi:1,4-dihydroxy-2-naphthoate octaprenyltransferase